MSKICSTQLWEKWLRVSKRSSSPATRAAFTSLDFVNLMEVFTKRARVLKSPPAFWKGAFRSCMRLALQEAERGRAEHNEVRSVRAWKLFLLHPRLVLHRSCRGGIFSLIGSRGESGCNCWQQVRRQRSPVCEAVGGSIPINQSVLSEELGAPRCWQIWVNYLPPGKLWKGPHWLQGISPRCAA